MPIQRKSFFTSLFILATASVVPAAAAQTPPSTTISLNYGGPGPCNFVLSSSPPFSINGQTGQMTATGYFDTSSSCPTGNSTGPAAVQLSANPTTVNVNEPVALSWSAVADVCRYDGSVFPVGLAGWPTSGDACVGASNCASAHNVSVTPTVGGIYNFKLTCTSGASSGQQQTVASKTVPVTVNGGTPPTDQCVAPVGLTRINSGKVAKGSGAGQTTTNYRHWETTFGFIVQSGTNYSWPGAGSNDAKYFFGKNQYAAFKFTVPSTFEYALDPGYAGGAYGAFSFGNTSDITSNVKYTISISKDCGDFTQNANDPQGRCIAEVTPGTGNRLYWAVRPAGNPSTFACDLTRGETYYFNMLPAARSNPTQTTCTATSPSACKINIANSIFNDVPGQTYRLLAPGEVPTD